MQSLQKLTLNSFKEFQVSNLPRSFWSEEKNQRKYLDFVLIDAINVTQYQKLYKTSHILSKIKEKDSKVTSFLKHKFQQSLSKCLTSVYPEFNWLPWKFDRIHNNLWLDDFETKKYLIWLEKKLNLNTPQDWQCVTNLNLKQNYGSILVRNFNGIQNILKQFYPEKYLKFENINPTTSKKSQTFLFQILTSLYPKNTLMIDYKHPQIKFSGSNKKIELDIFIPDLLLAFEYQGQGHFQQINSFQDIKQIKTRDKEKVLKCKQLGITLIEIPYFWDKTKEELISYINQKQNSLFLK